MYKKYFQIKSWTSLTGKWGPKATIIDINGTNAMTIGEFKQIMSKFDYYVEELRAPPGGRSADDGFMIHFPDQQSLDDFESYLAIIR